jgi:hypothetical protein
VTVTISRPYCPWIAERDYEYGPVLLAAFCAGNIEPQINLKTDKDHSYEGALQALATYAQLRLLAGAAPVAALDKWGALQKAGTLKAHLEQQAASAETGNRE